MKPIGNEHLPLWGEPECDCPTHRALRTEKLELFGLTNTMVPHISTGEALRDSALARSREGRQEKIAHVRRFLLEWSRPYDNELTGDEVLAVVEDLGYGAGDRRWTASVLKGWDAVKPTGRYTPSRRPECHARPKLIWAWVWKLVSPSP